jgi:hypothetical protein
MLVYLIFHTIGAITDGQFAVNFGNIHNCRPNFLVLWCGLLMEEKLKTLTIAILSCWKYNKAIDNLKLSRQLNSLNLSRALSCPAVDRRVNEPFDDQNCSRKVTLDLQQHDFNNVSVTICTALSYTVNLPFISEMRNNFKSFLLLSLLLALAWALAHLHFWGEIINLKCLKMEHCKNTVELSYNVLKVPYDIITGEYNVGLTARN